MISWRACIFGGIRHINVLFSLTPRKGTKRGGATPKAPNVLFIFFGAKKRTERSIHLSQALPYMEGCS